MSAVLILKTIHLLSAAVLLGTGLGIAFFMLMAHRSGEPRTVAFVGRMVVRADALFTATAVVVQPVTGILLARAAGYGLTEPWLVASYLIYVGVGGCWLPVVWIQWRMARLAQAAADAGEPLPRAYHRLFRLWFVLGWPGFGGVLAIYALMAVKPMLWLAPASWPG